MFGSQVHPCRCRSCSFGGCHVLILLLCWDVQEFRHQRCGDERCCIRRRQGTRTPRLTSSGLSSTDQRCILRCLTASLFAECRSLRRVLRFRLRLRLLSWTKQWFPPAVLSILVLCRALLVVCVSCAGRRPCSADCNRHRHGRCDTSISVNKGAEGAVNEKP